MQLVPKAVSMMCLYIVLPFTSLLLNNYQVITTVSLPPPPSGKKKKTSRKALLALSNLGIMLKKLSFLVLTEFVVIMTFLYVHKGATLLDSEILVVMGHTLSSHILEITHT